MALYLLHCCESLTVIKYTCEIVTILLEYCSGCFLKGKLNFQLHYIQQSRMDSRDEEIHYQFIHKLNYNYKSLIKIVTQVYRSFSHIIGCLQLNN